MKKLFFLVGSLASIILQAEHGPVIGMPNPASVNCEERGGTLEMRETALGQSGICTFEDWVGGCGGNFWLHSECEEWAFFRGECQRRTCFKWFLGDNGDSYCEKPIIR